MIAEDALIKYARGEGGDSDWNPALHPRAGMPPNPGWFAPSDGPQHESSQDGPDAVEPRLRFAANEAGSRRSDAAPTSNSSVSLPPGKPNDERANFADRFGFGNQSAIFADRFGSKDEPANFADRFGDWPDKSDFWSKVWPAIRAWLQEPVPEHDIDGGRVVGERPRWRAIAPYVGIPIATAGIFGLEAYAPAIAAWLGLGGDAAEVGAGAGLTGPRFLGSFPVPKDLKFGTTKFGDYAHEMIENVLKGRYPQANFIFRRTGVDVEVTEQKWIDTIGFRYAEIKLLTASGKSKLNQQILNWDLSAPVQPITYDAAGTVFWGFH